MEQTPVFRLKKGQAAFNELFEYRGKIFQSPKPVETLKRALLMGSGRDSLVLDFFGGSGTTAHAVMELNAMDGGKRRHITVQVADPCNPESDAAKAGFQTIAEVCKERIRRAGKKIKLENATTAPNLDIGLRVLKIDASNMADVYYAPDAVKQADLVAHTDNIKPDRTPEDLLFQVLVDWGVDLSLPITQETVAGKTSSLSMATVSPLASIRSQRRPRERTCQTQAAARRLPRQQLRQRQREDQRGANLQAPQPETEIKSL